MIRFYTYLSAWLHSEEGQDLAEYAILLALIALVVIAAVATLGDNILATFEKMAGKLPP